MHSGVDATGCATIQTYTLTKEGCWRHKCDLRCASALSKRPPGYSNRLRSFCRFSCLLPHLRLSTTSYRQSLQPFVALHFSHGQATEYIDAVRLLRKDRWVRRSLPGRMVRFPSPL